MPSAIKSALLSFFMFLIAILVIVLVENMQTSDMNPSLKSYSETSYKWNLD